jgi:hypothetical protein
MQNFGLSPKLFRSFWIQLDFSADEGSLVSVGFGEPDVSNNAQRCTQVPVSTTFNGDVYIGLSSWDFHVCYRMIKVRAPLSLHPAYHSHELCPQAPSSLFQIVQQTLCSWVQESLVCPLSILPTAELLNPGTRSLFSVCLSSLAGSLDTRSSEDYASLSFPSLGLILELNSLCISEKKLFDIVLNWIRWRQSRIESIHGSWLKDLYPEPNRPSMILTNEDLSRAYLEALRHSSEAEQRQSHISISCVSCASEAGMCYKCLLQKECLMAIETEAETLLSLIRYPLMTPVEVMQVWSTPYVIRSHQVVSHIARCLELDGHAMKGSIDQSGLRCRRSFDLSFPGAEACPPRTCGSAPSSSVLPPFPLKRQTRRRISGAIELSFVSNGDFNGVIRWIGSELMPGGQFLNPALSKKVLVTASSPPSKQTDTKAITDCRLVHCNIAGPRAGRDCQWECWWRLNLPGRKLLVNHYSIRSDGSTLLLLRDWDFQALAGRSEEGEEVWVTLRSHRMDRSITRTGQFASWPVYGPFSSLPYDTFRWISRGKHGGKENVMFPLSCVELYGFIFI